MRIACVHIPQLSVQVIHREHFDSDHEPCFVLIREDTRRIIDCSHACARLGIRPDMTLAAARHACSELRAFPHCPERDLQAMNALTEAFGRFGPIVAWSKEHNALWIDTTGVAGVSSTPDELEKVAHAMGYQAHGAVASTPFAALALASYGPEGERAPPLQKERRAVEQLPLRAAWLPATTESALDVIGIRTIGAFMALPGNELARRFGADTHDMWRQAHGRRVRPLVAHEPPRLVIERIAATNDDTAIQALEPLCFRVKTLIDRATKRLHGRGHGVEELQLDFELTEGGHWTTKLQLSQPTTHATLLLQLVRERISAQPPSSPIAHLELRVERSSAIEATQLDLFGDPAPSETIETTVARLAAILNTAPCFTAALMEDYRPERAYKLSPSLLQPEQTAAPPPGERPTRVLQKPAPVHALEQQPPGKAPPRAVSGPERLVTGWWDGAPIARDYWVVADRWGRRSWIFRELHTNRWYLHGHFD